MNKPEIVVCQDADELRRKAAAQFIEIANGAIGRSGRFAVALSGGSTPKTLYSLLASSAYRDRVDWSRIHLFWGDERCVPPEHPESNFRMAKEALLSKLKIPPQNIHRMAGEKEPSSAASEYERELCKFFELVQGQLPRFDLILLGLGDDGHTASLFPGSSAVNEQERLAVAPYVEKLKAHRLTLTLPVINNAAQVNFLVAGAAKRAIVPRVLDDADTELPAARVQPLKGKLTWLITQDAAAEIHRA